MAGRCPCGGLMVPALRYEASRTVEVRLCPDCWSEDPPFLQGRTRPKEPERKRCRRCSSVLKGARARVWCSRACQRADEADRRVKGVCPCGTPFSTIPSQAVRGRGRFCSWECWKAFAERHTRPVSMKPAPQPRRTSPLVALACEWCGAGFARKPKHRNARFCSTSCTASYGHAQRRSA